MSRRCSTGRPIWSSSSARGRAWRSPRGRGRDQAGAPGLPPRSVFCSSVGWGWTSTLKRRDARNSDTAPCRARSPTAAGRRSVPAPRGSLPRARRRACPAAPTPTRCGCAGRHAVIVAAEEREEVPRGSSCPSPTACPRCRSQARCICRGWPGRSRRRCSRVHVRVEVPSRNTCVKNLTPARDSCFVDARGGELVDAPMGMPLIRSITSTSWLGAPVPVHLGHQQEREWRKLPRCEQLAASRVRSSSSRSVFSNSRTTLARLQPPRVGGDALEDAAAVSISARSCVDDVPRCRAAGP